MWDLNVFQVLAAVLLDLLLGEPRGVPNLTSLCRFLSKALKRPCMAVLGKTVAGGWLFVGLVVGGSLIFFFAILVFLPRTLESLLEVFVFYQAFSIMGTQRHFRAIYERLKNGNLEEARQALSKMVARDTKDLDEAGISRTAIERIGERACESVVAPFFWGALLGPAGALLYRVTNTLHALLDSENLRQGRFGEPIARMDAVLNWLPGRMVAVLSETFREFRSFRRIVREAKRHRNSFTGWGEAAIAYSLGVRLGGTKFYQGEPLVCPIFHEAGAASSAETVKKALFWFWRISIFSFLLLLLASFNG